MYCNDKTKGLTRQRMDEATEVGADYLLTACPKCLTHFGCLHHENRWKPGEERFGYKVMDITQFLAERLPGEFPTGGNVDPRRKEPPMPGRKGGGS
jgi:Fe-S oxidoreductase